MAVAPSKGRRLVAKVDMLVETTDVPRGMSYRQAARKAVAMCVSDFASKGVRPDSFLVSLGLRRGVSDSQVAELSLGFADAAQEWGVRLVGGDTNESKELVVDCVMFGFADRIVPRSGARPGDVVVVGGRFGYPPAGLKILAGDAVADEKFSAKAKASVLFPTPNLKLGLSISRYFTSAMDSSDGLARSLHTLAEASGVGIVVSALPEAVGIRRFARSNRLEVERLVLAGGEEYCIVGTMPRKQVARAARAAKSAGGELIVIGKTDRRTGMVELNLGGSVKSVPDEGWTHLG